MMFKYTLPLLLVMASPAFAAQPLTLRQTVIVDHDNVTLGDLIDVPNAQSGTAVFASPQPGDTGVIQVSRIVDAAKGYGLDVVSPKWDEVHITRAARALDQADIKKAILAKSAIALGADSADLDIEFARIPNDIKIESTSQDPLTFSSFTLDKTSGRFEAVLYVPNSEIASQSEPLVASGLVAEMVDVLKLNTSVERGKSISSGDVSHIRIKRNQMDTSAVRRIEDLKNMSARRTLSEDTMLRTSDLAKTQLVARNDIVLVVYETSVMSVSTRGKALTNGTMGDVIEVLNPVSKRNVIATVTGQGQVLVSPPAITRRVADLSTTN